MKEINWTKWSSIAEIISSIAVLLTLVYLAVQTNQISEQTKQLAEQTKQNNAALLSSARQESLDAELALMYQLVNNNLVSGLVEEYSPEKQAKYNVLIQAMMRIRENLWWQYQSGVLDERTWKIYQGLLVRVIRTQPEIQNIWQDMQDIEAFDLNFVNEINELIDSD